MKYSDKKFNQDKVNSSLGFIYFMTERDLFGYPCGPARERNSSEEYFSFGSTFLF